MKHVAITYGDKKRPVGNTSPEIEVDDSFEQDWANGISGEEVVKTVHEQIKEWWYANKEDREA